MRKYLGEFRMETPAFGFLMNPRDESGKPPPNLPSEGGVFLRVSVARHGIGNVRGLLRRIDGATVAFNMRQSDLFPDKMEACSVMLIHPHTL